MSRLSAIATSPLLVTFAINASQAAIRPIGNFLAPICTVPDLNFRYKVYTSKNRYRLPSTKREFGNPVTSIGFTADDAAGILQPNALNFPIPNIDGLSDQALQYSVMEAQSTLADVSGLSLEQDIVSTATGALTGGAIPHDFSNDTLDPISILDGLLLDVTKTAKNGAPVKILFGTTAFKKFRNNAKVKGRFIIASGGKGGVGTVSPTIADVGGLLITNPDVRLSMMVIDDSPAGTAEDIEFILDEKIIIFASNDSPNRMDPSFMKTFAPMGSFFKPGSFITEDQRDEVLKMDWTTKPTITNTAAAVMVDTTT